MGFLGDNEEEEGPRAGAVEGGGLGEPTGVLGRGGGASVWDSERSGHELAAGGGWG